MTDATSPTILVIIGITGDLSKRKLLPAIEQIVKAGAGPDKLKIVGITRRDVQASEVLDSIHGDDGHDFLSQNLVMHKMGLTNLDEYQHLVSHLDEIEKQFGAPAQRVFYLSVPPQTAQSIIEMLGESGLANAPNTKLLLEKPFGVDYENASELIGQIDRYFKPEQVYRIDHYLAKEMAQNLVIFREGNALFRRTWCKDYIKSIEILVSEDIGIEGRSVFYEQTGALRDVAQSHLLQLAALTLMEVQSGVSDNLPERRLKALQQLHLPQNSPVAESVKRGQYEGYRDEVGNPDSSTETYVSLTLASSDPLWEGVPIKLTTGKALDHKATEIHITYIKDQDYESDELVIQIQPKESIELSLWTKVPGYDKKVERHSLSLHLKDHFDALPEAYEQVLLDAITSDHTLFASSDEVLETWRILKPVQDAWQTSADDLIIYKPGSAPTL